MISAIIYVFGILFILKLIVQFVDWLLSGGSTGINVAKCGKWAVVTGCTDGIGKEYALQLAKKGMNIVLLARNATLMDELSKQIESDYKVETKIIQQDIGLATPEDYQRIADELKVMEVGVLVNNVGMSYEHPDFFDQLPIERHRQLVDINIKSMIELTYAVLPGMIERKKGAIVNISSVSGLFPCPLLATYGATKAFVADWSDALNTEYKSKGIVVQSCVPAFVVSKLSKFKKPTFFIPTPSTFVKSAIPSIGAGPAVRLPYWPHWLQAFVILSLPAFAVKSYLMSLHLGIRAKALKKQKKG
jgi:17beta-estradiol 17-dehydrogenase / very-long-chain 3-oxoacyl-CoA reductase|uniref:Very-long-chain 3-oxoacyl-CoA reductase n=1 Tax=Eutreptiella gymnastica TaxID=73025 RepID=A0A7S4FHB3_9EUGL|mmetsp:Transcript_40079/g.66760  ORF Transcript_40079/g.66760 Transcript_40079/m.66760 type:complete len:303 (+) Transcript_40079:46-954(+)|eukprot:CAMPEP_0174286802 /NCGR_PEP_ID=MMETSP0809-20121228/13083_1 /TAXON_ID=73025 ORGANISM="Eutreptiella gymnastica-like, Strain CCMP1594" /NCGR_SAMPLE_ID=MMETSP0809 /ASSEMBLY_ACC=CAM_ASM_000658 /LENGTH=302 /DNA_ID=CAMNT_0015383013 /DNA_START=36 /DNA_END=944 /DNA_ORIENTATION=+